MIRPDLDRPAIAALPDGAALLDFDIPPHCIPGVRDALDALAEHWRIVAAFTVPDAVPR